jgi:hypothetical protein
MRPTPRLLAKRIFPGLSSPTFGAAPLIVHTKPFELTDVTEPAPPTNTTSGWYVIPPPDWALAPYLSSLAAELLPPDVPPDELFEEPPDEQAARIREHVARRARQVMARGCRCPVMGTGL